MQNLPQSIDATTSLLADQGYLADRALSTLTFLSLILNRPIFLEGDAGVGKTELAKVIAQGLGRNLLKMNMYYIAMQVSNNAKSLREEKLRAFGV